MKKHVPRIEVIQISETETVRVYRKTETDDHFLFRKSMSISINAKALEDCDMINVILAHRGVDLVASKDEIKSFKDVKTFNGEIKYYYPIEKFKITEGDHYFVKKIRMDADSGKLLLPEIKTKEEK